MPTKQNNKRRKVQFEFEVFEAESVYIAGDFNGWDITSHTMKKNGNGKWEKTLMLPPGTYEYKFFVDGCWENDPKNDKLCLNSFGTHNNLILIN